MSDKIQDQKKSFSISQKIKDSEEASPIKNINQQVTIEIEDLIPGLPKFDKIYENRETNLFKEDILNYLRDRDKCIYGLINTYKEKVAKAESNYLELTKRISNNYSDILSSQAEINNRLDRINTYDAFCTKTNDQLISHEIRINNLREDLQKSTQKYDKIYLENLELPGYIGKYSKYKNCQVFFEDVIKEINKMNLYKEKNTLDLKAYKEKLELNIKTFNALVDNNNKSQMKYINEMHEKNFKECKTLIDTLDERITDMRIENSRYAVELISKSMNLTKEWDKIQKIKEEIMTEFNEKIQEFHVVSNNTVNSFSDFQNEFNSIKRKFLELAEFIKDVRFRKNIGGDVKKRELKNIAKKITGKKSCGKSIDKEKEKILMDYNFKEEKTIDLKRSVSHELDGKLKNYIKGVTNAEELKQDSKIHEENDDKVKKKSKGENKSNSKNLNIREENNLSLRKHKNNTVVNVVHNLRNLRKEKTESRSDESDNSENNSISNIAQSINSKNSTTVEKTGNKQNNYGNNTNTTHKFLYKDILIDTEDKIINELASDLEQTNNKGNDTKEKSEKIQTLINKIEPMNINMNINKIENLNYNNNEKNNKEKATEIKIEENDENIIKENKQIDNIILNFDRKLTNMEIYTKEKIVDLVSQIENLRQLFTNANKNFNSTTNQLFKFPSYTNININTNTLNPSMKKKEAPIVEIGGRMMNYKIPKKYLSNTNSAIASKDKENNNSISNSNRELNVLINKGETSSLKDISYSRIKTGKPSNSIKSIINRTLGGNNNTIIFSNMANDFNNKFLKGIEKKSINGGKKTK